MKFLFAVLIGFSLLGCAVGKQVMAQASMNGVWEEVVTREGVDEPYSVLTLDLSVVDGRIAGRYCFVTRFGRKIDCDPDAGDNLRGLVDAAGTMATISFDSSFGAMDGKATLTLQDHSLHWDLVSPPVGGEFFGPRQAQLTRPHD